MLRLGRAALCVAGVLAFAGQAGATIVAADIQGLFTTASGPPGWYTRAVGDDRNTIFNFPTREDVSFGEGGVGWRLDFTFDTSLGVRTTDAFTDVLSWDGALGAPSPLLGAALTAFGETVDLSDVTSFSVRHDQTGLGFNFTGSTFQFDQLLFQPFSGFAPIDLSEGFSWMTPDFNSGALGDFHDATYAGGDDFMASATFTPDPAPEPATWATLILGFFATGWALRRRALPTP